MSPVSLHSVLALTYFGARGRTADQMAAGLKLTSNQDGLKTGFRLLFTSLKVNGKLESAMRMGHYGGIVTPKFEHSSH